MRHSRWLALAALVACTPTVQVTAPEPIVINLNISHEVRVKIDREVDGILEQEKRAESGVGSRSLEDVSPALADAREVADAKQARQIGERADGYLGVVPGATAPDASELAERVNAVRREDYARLAESHGVPLESVAAVAGARRIAATPAGWPVMTADGRWTTAPGKTAAD